MNKIWEWNNKQKRALEMVIGFVNYVQIIIILLENYVIDVRYSIRIRIVFLFFKIIKIRIISKIS